MLIRLILGFCLVLLPGAASAGFVACQVTECVKPVVAQASCVRKVLVFRSIDQACVARNFAAQSAADAAYSACLAQQTIDKSNCEALNATRSIEQNTGNIGRGDTFKTNGVACVSSQECESGYCLPGPGKERAVSSIPENSSVIWYCAHPKANCALPGANGGVYGDTRRLDGVKVVCQNPGRGLWGQFYPPE